MCEDGKIRSGCNGRIPGRPNRCGIGREGHAPFLGQKPWGRSGTGGGDCDRSQAACICGKLRYGCGRGGYAAGGGGGRIPHDAPERCMPVSGTAGARLCRPEPSGCLKRRAGLVRSRRGPVDEYVGLPGSGRRSRTARSFTAGVSSKLGKRFSAGRRLVRGMRRLRSVRSMAGDVRRSAERRSAVRDFTAPPADFLGRGGADRFDRGGARTADAAAAHDRYGFAYDDTMH